MKIHFLILILSSFALPGCKVIGNFTSKQVTKKPEQLSSPISKPADNWAMRTKQINVNTLEVNNSNTDIAKDNWKHDTLNEAFIGPNTWGFQGNAPGSQNLKDVFVNWSYEKPKDSLKLEWYVGGYHRNYSGKPEHGWDNNGVKGGNNVKAYPRMGIGSASGQPVATTGSPNNLPVTDTGGVKTVDQYEIQKRVGIPSRIATMPEIDVHVDFTFSGGSLAVDPKDRYGNFYFAIDSYLHDIDKPEYLINSAFTGSLNGINDSSGSIFNTQMSSLSKTSKRWAIMVWYHKPPYFDTSGGEKLNNDVAIQIDGANYFIRYKVESAGGKKFKYISFIRDRTTADLTRGGAQPVIRYKRFIEYVTDGRLQTLLDQQGPLLDIDGVKKKIIAPSTNFVLSDINVGVEVSSNPDTSLDHTPRPVAINFKKLFFKVSGKDDFGFK